LSANAAALVLAIATGGVHAACPAVPPWAAVATSSVRATAIASTPLTANSFRFVAKLALRLA
jgi:hypothetical protein